MMRLNAFIWTLFIPLQSPSQTGSGLMIHPPAITRIHADFVQVRKTIVGSTLSVPPHYIYKIEGYDYTIQFELLRQDSTMQIGSSFGIVCFLPNGEIRQFPIVESHLMRTSPEIFEYSLPLEIQIEGLYRFLIASEDELTGGRHPKHYQDVSNTQSLYLLTPPE